MKLSRFERERLRVRLLVQQETDYTFPEFLFNLRQICGITRKTLAFDLKIKPQKITDIELSRIYLSYYIEPSLIEKMADYFDVPYDLLERKVIEWEKKGKHINFEEEIDEYYEHQKLIRKNMKKIMSI